MLYPIKFKSIYVDKIWGNDRLKKINRDIPSNTIGESIELIFRDDTMSVVENGELKGKTIKDLLEVYGYDFSGTNVNPTRQFPLMIKIITSSIDQSAQVHPDDGYARRRENDYGNTECFYVLNAEEGSSIVAGVNTRNKDDIFNLNEDVRLSNYLRQIPVRKGDFIDIPAGTIHAIGKGLSLLEIEQNSQVTYRIYDYGSRARNNDGHKAREVLEIRNKPESTNLIEAEEFKYTNKHYTIDRLIVEDSYKGKGNPKSMKILTCVEGSAKIVYQEVEYTVNEGDTYIIPAKLKDFKIKGNAKFLRITLKKERIL